MDNFEHFNGKWLDIKKENMYQKVPEMIHLIIIDHPKNSGEWV